MRIEQASSPNDQISFGPPVMSVPIAALGRRSPWMRNRGQKAPYSNQRTRSSLYSGSSGSPLKNPPMSVVHHGMPLMAIFSPARTCTRNDSNVAGSVARPDCRAITLATCPPGPAQQEYFLLAAAEACPRRNRGRVLGDRGSQPRGPALLRTSSSQGNRVSSRVRRRRARRPGSPRCSSSSSPAPRSNRGPRGWWSRRRRFRSRSSSLVPARSSALVYSARSRSRRPRSNIGW